MADDSPCRGRLDMWQQAFLVLVVSIGTYPVSALGVTFFALDVTANPFVTPGYSISESLSGEAEYSVAVLQTDAPQGGEPLATVSIRFNTSVFASPPIVQSVSANAAQWIHTLFLSGDSWRVAFNTFAGGAPYIEPGDALVFEVTYLLRAPALELAWGGAGPWEQSFLANSPSNRTIISTSQLIPEPTPSALVSAGIALSLLARKALRVAALG
jgi:hypothetical protein